MNKDLCTFIKSELEKGTSENTIIDLLQEKGWNQEEVFLHINYIKNNKNRDSKQKTKINKFLLGGVTLFILVSLFIFILATKEEEIEAPLYSFSNTQDENNLGGRFYKNQNKVYYNGSLIIGAESNSFEYISDTYAKDDLNVYLGARVIKSADPQTFVVLGGGFSKDVNNVYGGIYVYKEGGVDSFQYLGGPSPSVDLGGVVPSGSYTIDEDGVKFGRKLIQNADPGTFEYLGGVYAKDINNIYSHGVVIDGVDVGSFEILSEVYGLDQKHIFRLDEKIFNIDINSLKYLGSDYLKDQSKVIWSGREIKEADPQSFMYLNGMVGKDKDHVYFGGIIMDKVDRGSVEYVGPGVVKDGESVYILKLLSEAIQIDKVNKDSLVYLGEGYYKDKKDVYVLSKQDFIPLDKANPKYFKVIPRRIGFDKNRIYYAGVVINNVDLETFQFFNDAHAYAYDKSNIYIRTGPNAKDSSHFHVFEGVDKESFEIIDSWYARDKNNVYYKKEILSDANPSTFKYLNNQLGVDANNAYYLGSLVNVDIETYQKISTYYFKDKNNVYYRGQRIFEADPDTFELVEHPYSKDKNNVYQALYGTRGWYVEEVFQADPRNCSLDNIIECRG